MNKYAEWIMNTHLYYREKLRRNDDTKGKPSILVISFHPLGDTVIESPVIRALRENYPHYHIMVVCAERNKDLWEYCPYIDELVVYDSKANKHYYQTNLQRCHEFAEKYFRDKRFDVAIIASIFMPSLIEAWLVYLSHASRRLSFSEKLNPTMHHEYMGAYDRFFTDVFSEHHMHDVLEYKHMLETLQCPMLSTTYELWTSEGDKEYAKKLYYEARIDRTKPICLVVLNASDKSRDWPVENYVEVCNKIREHLDIEYLVLGYGRQAMHDADIFCHQVTGAHNFINKTTVRQLIEVVRQANYYLGCDTGAMHMAAAANLKGVAIFKSADNTCWRMRNHACHYPWQADIKALHPKEAITGCENGCNKGKAHCIKLVTADEVYQNMMDVLKGSK